MHNWCTLFYWDCDRVLILSVQGWSLEVWKVLWCFLQATNFFKEASFLSQSQKKLFANVNDDVRRPMTWTRNDPTQLCQTQSSNPGWLFLDKTFRAMANITCTSCIDKCTCFRSGEHYIGRTQVPFRAYYDYFAPSEGIVQLGVGGSSSQVPEIWGPCLKKTLEWSTWNKGCAKFVG